jgi:hypothetical protein
LLEEVKRQLIAEKGLYRALLIPIVLVLAFIALTLTIDIAVAVIVPVGIFLAFVFILNLLLPDSLTTVAFSAGARGLSSGIGIVITLCFIVARYMATFLWWSRWVWVALIAPFALFFGIRNFYNNVVSSVDDFQFSNLNPANAGLTSFLISVGDGDPGYNLITFLMIVACCLMWGSMAYCSWWCCGKALKFAAENM